MSVAERTALPVPMRALHPLRDSKAKARGRRAGKGEAMGRWSGWVLSVLVHSGAALITSITLTQVVAGTGRGPGTVPGEGVGQAGNAGPAFEVSLREGSPSILSEKEEEIFNRAVVSDSPQPEDFPERPEVSFDPFSPSPREERRETQPPLDEAALPRRSPSAYHRLPTGEAGGTGEAAVLPEGARAGPENAKPLNAQGSGASGAGTGTGGSGDGILVAVYTPKPDYPIVARRKRIEGMVVLELSIESDGVVSAATLVESSGCEALDQAALEKVKEWKYERKLGESPRAALVQRVRCVFRLDP